MSLRCHFFQPLNYERKKTYTLHIEGTNTHVDPRFSYLGPFKDTSTLKITVGDVDEAPVFSMDTYILDVYENAPSGTEVGAVTAQDPDSRNSPVRYDTNSYFMQQSAGMITNIQRLSSTVWLTVGLSSYCLPKMFFLKTSLLARWIKVYSMLPCHRLHIHERSAQL